MKVGFVNPKRVVTVMFLQFLEVYTHNLQHADPNFAHISGETITLSNYADEKVRVDYPNPGADFDQSDQSSLDTWSVVWYIASFGGLILFFLVVSCSEWCCRRNARRNCQRNNSPQAAPRVVPDTPPPSYDHFAPPAYEDLLVGGSRRRTGEKSEYDIYVVPVHALGTIMEEARREDAPPSYQSASAAAFAQPRSDFPRVHSPNAANAVT